MSVTDDAPVTEQPATLPVIDKEALLDQLQQSPSPLPVVRPLLKSIREECHEYFRTTRDAITLVRLRSDLIDQILDCLWQHSGFSGDNIALLAVGGYGRGELQPHSDIDLLILLKDEQALDQHKDALQSFITLLWDLKLDIGHSVRTLDECAEEAGKDLTIITNMMETRTLSGPGALRSALQNITATDKLWPSQSFFSAKWQELRDRHSKHEDTEYNLEPNVKNSPGTLRDIQTINWIALRHFGYGDGDLNELVNHGFLTRSEVSLFHKGISFFWQVRYALHMVTDREEDRLLFDVQKDIADILGYQDNDEMLGVEQLMLQFYRHQLALTELTDLLLLYFNDEFLGECNADTVLRIDGDFCLCNNYLRLNNPDAIADNPSLLLKVFVEFARQSDATGIHSETIRALRNHRELIDEKFRQTPEHQDFFIELLRNNLRVSGTLKRMMRYGILGRYIPEFGSIIGHMQYDLFHIYTVDEHSLRMVQLLRRFRYSDEREQFPVASRIIHRVKHKEVLYLTALLHDAGKMCRGEHEIAGAEIADRFCRTHRLSPYNCELVSWLVRNHLLMSQASQRIDLNNPDDIHQFAQEVGDVIHLDHLFLISISDIVSTNPKLWTGWRAEQMRTLYHNTKQALRRGLENPVAKEQRIEAIQNEALEILKHKNISEEHAREIWDEPGDDYYLREGAQNIAWHTQIISAHGNSDSPLIEIRETSDEEFEGATQIFIFMKDQPHLFAATTVALDQLNLNIQDARIVTSNNRNAVDTYIVLDENGNSVGSDPEQNRAH